MICEQKASLLKVREKKKSQECKRASPRDKGGYSILAGRQKKEGNAGNGDWMVESGSIRSLLGVEAHRVGINDNKMKSFRSKGKSGRGLQLNASSIQRGSIQSQGEARDKTW